MDVGGPRLTLYFIIIIMIIIVIVPFILLEIGAE
jgi:hypothetical protein